MAKLVECDDLLLLTLTQAERLRLNIVVYDTCERCGQNFVVQRVGKGRFCSNNCSALVRVTRHNEKLKRLK